MLSTHTGIWGAPMFLARTFHEISGLGGLHDFHALPDGNVFAIARDAGEALVGGHRGHAKENMLFQNREINDETAQAMIQPHDSRKKIT